MKLITVDEYTSREETGFKVCGSCERVKTIVFSSLDELPLEHPKKLRRSTPNRNTKNSFFIDTPYKSV